MAHANNLPGSGFDSMDGGGWIVLEASSLDKTQKYTDGVDIMLSIIYLYIWEKGIESQEDQH